VSLAATSGGLSRVGRDGWLGLRFEQRQSRTVIAASRSTVPLQVLAPVVVDEPTAVVVMLNPTGGLAGGDRLVIDATAMTGAHACLTTASATKVYRTTGPPAEQHVRLTIGPGATLEYVPDHTIPFAGSDLRQRIDVEMAEGGRLIIVDAFAAGRVARGEAWRFAHLESAITVRDAGGWRFYDRLALLGNPAWAGLGFTEDHAYFATVLVIGPGSLDGLRREAAAVMNSHEGVAGGAGLLPRGGVVVRVLARDAPALFDTLAALWSLARQVLLGLGPLALRKL
jgi:urease accessory protein